MIKRLASPAGREIEITFNGTKIVAHEGENLAAVLLAAGIGTTRKTPATGAPRAPFCLMGTCFDCLVEVEGENVQACMTTVREGMAVRQPQVPDGDENG